MPNKAYQYKRNKRLREVHFKYLLGLLYNFFGMFEILIVFHLIKWIVLETLYPLDINCYQIENHCDFYKNQNCFHSDRLGNLSAPNLLHIKYVFHMY